MVSKKEIMAGNALTEYGIIIALIALALIPIVFFTGKYIVDCFESFYQQTKDYNETIDANQNSTKTTPTAFTSSENLPAEITDNDVINGTLKAGALGGTSDKPAYKCAGDVCTIDYGEFILNGVPADFGALVQSSGTSGGTDTLAALLDQIAEQFKEEGNTDGYEDYKKLAELSHFMADVQSSYETTIKEYKVAEEAAKATPPSPSTPSSPSPSRTDTPLYDSIVATSRPALRDSISDLLTNYNGVTATLSQQYYDPIRPPRTDDAYINITNGVLNRVDLARAYASGGALEDAALFDQASTRFPAFALVKQYDKIMSNTAYPPELLGITQKLYQNISSLAYDQAEKLRANADYAGDKETTSVPEYDSLTGEALRTGASGTNRISMSDSQIINEITRPNVSNKTDLNAALICTKGKNYDNGNECK